MVIDKVPKNFHGYLSLLLCFSLIAEPSFAQWERKQDANKPRSEVTSVVYNNKLYTFLGFSDSYLNVENTSEVYDPVSNTWSLLDTLPLNKVVTHQGVTLIDNSVWHIGGRVGKNPGPLTSETWIYNILSNSWSPGPQLLDPATGKSLLWGGGGAALLGRTLHVFGGFVNSACNNDQSSYHLTLDVDEWLANPTQPAKWKNILAPLPIKRNHFSTIVLAGKIYALGGQFSHDCGGGQDKNFSHVYERSTNTWTELPLMPEPRSHAEGSTFALDGKIYIVAGQSTNGVNTNKVTIFDPAANNGSGAWTDDSTLTLPTSYEGLSSKVIGNTFIISHGGEGASTRTRKTTYTRSIARTLVNKLGFLPSCSDIRVDSGKTTTLKPLLFTIDGTKNFVISSNSTWLKITKNTSGTALTTGTDIEVTINTAGMEPGNYKGVITASGTGEGLTYSAAEYCVNLTVQSPSNVLEAENAFLFGAVVASNHTGHTGKGFADYINSSGDYIEWATNIPESGSAKLEFRYANGSTNNRPLKLEVNGVVVASSLDFLPTGNWSTWSTISFPTTLIAGINKIKLSAIGASGGNIDYLKVVVLSDNILEAENAFLYQAKVDSIHAGYTGKGFADFVNGSDDYIEWQVNQPHAASASLYFRYANGSKTNRPLKLEVNDSVVMPSLDFPPTGSWTNWNSISYPVTLNAGINKVKLTAIGSSGGNIDHAKVVVTKSILEAEDAFLYRTIVESIHTGFTGKGFADYINNSDDYIEWSTNRTSSDSVLLQFRYANGSSTNRKLKLEINNVVVNSLLDFPPTGSWSVWSIVSIATQLTPGINTIRLTAIGSSGANIDHLILSEEVGTATNTFLKTSNKESIEVSGTKLSVTVAPNPASHNIKINWNPISEVPVEISLINVQGVVYKTVFVSNSSIGSYNLPVHQFPEGLYFVHIRQGKERSSAKIFIKRN